MNYLGSLISINEKIKNWDFKRKPLKEYLDFLEEKNKLVSDHTSVHDFLPSCRIPSRNVCAIKLPAGNPEDIAFHVGFPHQTRLHALEDASTRERFTTGVFFSLDPKDVVFFSGDFEKFDEMTYFLDIKSVKGARVQTNYKDGVISRYDLDDLIHANPAMDSGALKDRVKELNARWLAENTIPFRYDDVHEARAKFFSWLIVPDPIEVRY